MHIIIYLLLKNTNNLMLRSKFQRLDKNLDTGLNRPPTHRTHRTGRQRDGPHHGAAEHKVSQPLLQEVPADGEGARLTETQVAARLDQNSHLGGKAHLKGQGS